MLQSVRHARRRLVALAAAALTAATLPALPAGSASAATLSVKPTEGSWGTDGRVLEILPLPGGQKVIAGTFANVVDPSGGLHPAANLALLDHAGALVSSWTAGTDGEVDALGLSGDRILIGGAFGKVNGTAHRSLAALNVTTGALDKTFSATTNGRVNSIAVAPAFLVIGGTFGSVKTKAQGTVARTRLAKITLPTGTVDTTWTASPNSKVNAVVLSDDFGTVFAGGVFTTVNGSARARIAALSTDGPAALLPFHEYLQMPVLKLAYYDGHLYMAADGYYGGICASMDPVTGAWVWVRDTNGNVQAVTAYDGVAYCGGHFSQFGSSAVKRQHIAAVSTTAPYATTSWAPRVNSAEGVWALANDGSQLLAGGDFTQVGPKARTHYAQFAG